MFSTVALNSEWQKWVQKRTDKIWWTHKPVNRKVSGAQMGCSHCSPYLNPWHFCWNFLRIINHMGKWSPIVACLIKSVREPLNCQKMKIRENSRIYLMKQNHQLHVPLFWHMTLQIIPQQWQQVYLTVWEQSSHKNRCRHRRGMRASEKGALTITSAYKHPSEYFFSINFNTRTQFKST